MRSINQLMDLSGRRALIPGGAGHIGLAVSEALLELGATVAILDLDKGACEKRVAELSRIRPGSAIAVPCDLGNEEATRAAVRQVEKELGGLEIIVHCAAHIGTKKMPGWSVPFEQQTVAAWDCAMRVNLTSAFVLAQSAFPSLAKSGHGAICLISSIYGMVGPDKRLYEGTEMANPAGYGASKGGLIQLTRYLATMMAPAVRVNCVSPGGIFRDQPEIFISRYTSRTPLGRMGTEEDLKGAVSYLVSDLSAYVTGHNLVVDGGWTAW